ncbi:unnamed protein product [Rotaria socialis]|uniref:ubiquitinyl hydrolase 1 n=1 Tax=Rotaria socialis TaxID=392032 RepID=A0A818ZP96_9BILA|nr:unnamed protein product [Rotaria socialis]CAF4591584.1 unnamed protein product [Rotaria socialis]
MNYFPTKSTIRPKRRSVSVNLDDKSKQLGAPSLPKLNRKSNASRQKVSSLFILPRNKHSASVNTTKMTVSPRSTTETIPGFYKQISPPIKPRTIVSSKSKVDHLPIPKERKSTNNSQTNKDFHFAEKQMTTVNAVNELEKLILPNVNNTGQSSSDEKISTSKNTTQSTCPTPGLCGLINIGNTCYMNSALQCLSNIPELTQWALNQKQHSTRENEDIIAIYTSLIQSIWSGENTTVNPRDIKEIVSRSAPIFIGHAQRDSHEFLNSLLNALERTKSISIIADLFHIHTKSQVTCTGCNFIDMTDEITTFLPLPLPLPKRNLFNNEILLENLIQDFCLEENLDGLYYCNSCKQYVQAKQKTIICLPLPRVLVIQLKRFPFDHTFQKIDTFVRYKLEYKNLISNNDRYKLCAASCHVGSLSCGHYTTVAKNTLRHQWYEFNDNRVNEINQNAIITSNAYVLVYLKSDDSNSSIS